MSLTPFIFNRDPIMSRDPFSRDPFIQEALSEFLMPSSSWGSMPSSRSRSISKLLACDIIENENNYCVAIDMPGIERSEVEVSCNENTLIIKAERKQCCPETATVSQT